ncbi:uncharacterized protein LOC112085044 [Eutrema salsugineum]|uniref:uncharacterized protein LOC112085044 n=1 Tax=Eutrema salsugineum TaxID=72664 RepID=UPI000CED6F01|nr:uncharacterized protein LOC112085044 [Eutrema salsugineum]
MVSDPPASGSALPPSITSTPSQKSPWFATSTNSPARNSVSCEVVNGIAKTTIPADILSNAQPLWTIYIIGYFIGDAPHISKTVRPAFGCLLETRVQETNYPNILDTVFTRWSSTTNYDLHRLGRIWVIWSDVVSISPLYKSPQVITIEVTYASGLSFVCSCVYASNFSNDLRVWQELRGTNEFLRGTNTPWIIMGDFNQTLSSDEHSRAADYFGDQSAMRDFQQFVTDCEVMDLGYVGSHQFTWLNQQEENCNTRVRENLTKLENLVKGSMENVSWPRFLGSLAGKFRQTEFFGTLSEFGQGWSGTDSFVENGCAQERLSGENAIRHRKLKSLKVHLRELNLSRYGDITRRTSKAFDNICEKQQQTLHNPSSENIAAADAASSLWHHYSAIEERFFQQKSRITWLKNGDSNTKFFHRVAQGRRSKNSINKLLNANGNTLTDMKDIKEEAEIRSDLHSIPSNKTPGSDGFTAVFYIAAWPIISADFVVAVQSYFLYGFMPHGVNATMLCLAPKTIDAQTMCDYRPIACCNLIYKVISKIIANRLKQILPEGMVSNQSAFIKGRLLLENVLLATELTKDYHKDSISA